MFLYIFLIFNCSQIIDTFYIQVTHLIENRYNTTKEVIIKRLKEITFLCFTSDILTITNSTRSFLVLTVHFIDIVDGSPVIQSLNLCAQKLSQVYLMSFIILTPPLNYFDLQVLHFTVYKLYF